VVESSGGCGLLLPLVMHHLTGSGEHPLLKLMLVLVLVLVLALVMTLQRSLLRW